MCVAGIASPGEVWQHEQADAVRRLQALAQKLRHHESGVVDLTSDEGAVAAAAFLRGLRAAGLAMHVKFAPRDYRQERSVRFHDKWVDQRCLYSFKVLGMSLRGSVYVNGGKYPLSQDAGALSSRLHARWADACRVLTRSGSKPAEYWDASERARLRRALGALDEAWASFEQLLLEELAVIVPEARSLTVETKEHLANMDVVRRRYEAGADPYKLVQDPEFLHHRALLVDCISRLNRLANPRDCGRELQLEVLRSAEALIQTCLSQPEHPDAPLLPLALDATRAFDDVCVYLYNLPKRREEVHPTLGNNADLMGLLASLGAIWEVAADYLVNESGRQTLCALTSSVRYAQRVAPALEEMCEARTAELFMVLPRIVWLSFLAAPTGPAPLIRTLMPHRIGEDDGLGDGKLLSLMDDFRWTREGLSATFAAAATTPQQGVGTLVKDFMLRSAVSGVGGDMEELEVPSGSHADRGALEQWQAFIRNLEGWSLELQRCHAADWNRFCATLLRCVDSRRGTRETHVSFDSYS